MKKHSPKDRQEQRFRLARVPLQRFAQVFISGQKPIRSIIATKKNEEYENRIRGAALPETKRAGYGRIMPPDGTNHRQRKNELRRTIRMQVQSESKPMECHLTALHRQE